MCQAVEEKLPESLIGLGYTESFKIIDTKLALGYIGAALAAGTFYLERKFKFNDVLPYTTALVLIYFLIQLYNWYFLKFIAKKIIYKGYNNKDSLEISGEYDKFTPEYNLTFKVIKNDQIIEFKEVLKFTDIFDTFGTLRQELLNKFISSKINEHATSKNK